MVLVIFKWYNINLINDTLYILDFGYSFFFKSSYSVFVLISHIKLLLFFSILFLSCFKKAVVSGRKKKLFKSILRCYFCIGNNTIVCCRMSGNGCNCGCSCWSCCYTKVRKRKKLLGVVFDPAIHIKEIDRELGIFF